MHRDFLSNGTIFIQICQDISPPPHRKSFLSCCQWFQICSLGSFSIVYWLVDQIWYDLLTCDCFFKQSLCFNSGHLQFTTKHHHATPWFFRCLVATYRVILEQNPSSILISDAIGPEKWVVENFDFISPGLFHIHVIFTTIYDPKRFIPQLQLRLGFLKIEKCKFK